MIGISPLIRANNVERKVRVESILIDFALKQLTVVCAVFHFNQTGEPIPNIIAPKEARLVASNEVLVNEQGEYLDAPIEGAIGEFDFWEAYLQKQVFDFNTLQAQLVQRADSLKRFDNLY